MIINKEKLEGCTDNIKRIVKHIENIYGVVTINSGYRTAQENTKVGGSVNSAHMRGEAVDLSVKDVTPIKIASKLLDANTLLTIKGIGIDVYRNYLHVDEKDRGVREIVYWPYGKNGKIAWNGVKQNGNSYILGRNKCINYFNRCSGYVIMIIFKRKSW